MALKKYSNPRFRKTKQKGWNNTFVYDFGCKFRSKFEWYTAKRLENAHIKWQHEPRIRLQNSYCLPDFWLPEYSLFIELRPKRMVDEKLRQKAYLLKKIYNKDVVIILDLQGAETFISKLLLCKKEPQKLSPLNEIMIFEGQRGRREENKHNAISFNQ